MGVAGPARATTILTGPGLTVAGLAMTGGQGWQAGPGRQDVAVGERAAPASRVNQQAPS